MSEALASIAEEISACRACRLCETAEHAVAGEGPVGARVFLVGQAPGAREDQAGRPFVGRAGRFLEQMLTGIGLTRQEVFITSAVKHFPPGNRAPKRDELEACLPFLIRQIEVVNPEIVVLLGRTAARISNHSTLVSRKVIVTVHPSAAMRFPALAKRMQADFQRLKAML